MTTPSGNSWEPEPVAPAAVEASPYAAPGGPSPYAAPGTAVPPAPGYAALYPAAPSGGPTPPPAPGYAGLYPAASYPPPAAPYQGAAPGYPAPGYGYPAATAYQRAAVGPMPPTHLALAIVALILAWIPGLVALVYSLQVESRWRSGDLVGARQASESARKWGRWTVILTITLTAVWLVAVVGMSLLSY